MAFSYQYPAYWFGDECYLLDSFDYVQVRGKGVTTTFTFTVGDRRRYLRSIPYRLFRERRQ